MSHRALVLGALASPNVFEEPPALGVVLTRAESALAEGADGLTIPAREGVGSLIAALRRRFDLPLGIAAARPDRLAAAFDAGATLAIVNCQRAELFEVVERAGASLILVAPHAVSGARDVVDRLTSAAARAASAGIPAPRVIVDVGLQGRSINASMRVRLEAVPALTADGHVVGVDTLFRDAASTAGIVAAGVVRGCRLVAATDVRAARRTVDVLAAVADVREAGES